MFVLLLETHVIIEIIAGICWKELVENIVYY